MVMTHSPAGNFPAGFFCPYLCQIEAYPPFSLVENPVDNCSFMVDNAQNWVYNLMNIPISSSDKCEKLLFPPLLCIVHNSVDNLYFR